MKTVLMAAWLTLLVVFGLPAFGMDVIARQGDASVTLHDTDCPADLHATFALDANVIMMQMDIREAHAATYSSGASQVRACWVPMGESRVYLRYEDGDVGVIPMTDFKPVEKL